MERKVSLVITDGEYELELIAKNPNVPKATLLNELERLNEILSQYHPRHTEKPIRITGRIWEEFSFNLSEEKEKKS